MHHSSSAHFSPSQGSSDYTRLTPVSRPSSSYSASKKREERPDSLSKDKTASLSPHAVLHSGEEGEIGETGSAEKRRFTVLNTLERKGLTQRQIELEQEIARHPTDATRLALAKAKLQEMESCYQSTRDAFVKSQKDLQSSQADNKRLREESSVKDARLEKLQKDLNEALKGRRLAEDDKSSYRRHYHNKREQLADAESKLAAIEESHANRINQASQEWERKNETLSSLLKQEKESHAETLMKFRLIQIEFVNVKSRLDDLEGVYKSLNEANAALQGNFSAEQRKNEELVREIREAKIALSTLDSRSAEFQSTILEQAACIQGIEKLLQNHHAATLTKLF